MVRLAPNRSFGRTQAFYFVKYKLLAQPRDAPLLRDENLQSTRQLFQLVVEAFQRRQNSSDQSQYFCDRAALHPNSRSNLASRAQPAPAQRE